MAGAVARLGTLWEQLCALPSNQLGEIVGGKLFASPRPAGPHARVTSKLGGKLDGPFDGGEGGPGGWIILYEPELHLGDAVLVPDLAAWRRERMPYVAEEVVAFEIAPDWVCEVLSPSRVRSIGFGSCRFTRARGFRSRGCSSRFSERSSCFSCMGSSGEWSVLGRAT